MGCGMSTLEAEEPSHNRRSNRPRSHANVLPANKPIMKKDYDNDDDDEEVKTKDEGERLKEEKVFVEVKGKEEHGGDDKHVKNIEEENDEERDDIFIGPGSPSFREYCNDHDSTDRSSIADFNDCCSDELNIKNGGDDDSTNRTESEKSANSNKEPEKKERRGRGFRKVMNKGKARGRKNLLNFACYNSSTQSSYAEGSLNKVVAKTT